MSVIPEVESSIPDIEPNNSRLLILEEPRNQIVNVQEPPLRNLVNRFLQAFVEASTGMR